MYHIKLNKEDNSITLTQEKRDIKLVQEVNNITLNQTGREGKAGRDGVDGKDGTNGTDGKDGIDGVGVPTGGNPNQVLAKVSSVDFDTQWVDPSGGDVESVNGQTGTVVLDADDIDDTSTTHKFTTSGDISKLAGIEAGAEVNTVDSVAGKTGAVTLAKGDVGLGNVDNTSDLNKPISTATQTALNDKADDTTLIAALPSSLGANNQIIKMVGGVPAWAADANTTYAIPTQIEAEAGTATTGRAFSAQRVNQAIQALSPVTSVNGDTGNVVLDATDIDFAIAPGTSVEDGFIQLVSAMPATTDDLTEGTTNLYSQWQRVTRSSIPLIEPAASDNLHIGPLTDFSTYSTFAAAKAWFTTSNETSFFVNIASGPTALLPAGAVFMGMRTGGTLDAPTSMGAGAVITGLYGIGLDSNNASTLTADGKILFSAVQTRVRANPTAGNVGQEVHIGSGFGGNGVIRANSLDQLGFFAGSPVSKPTVTGSRGGNAALASLLTALASLGLITNSSSA